jgi:hypothetical protein
MMKPAIARNCYSAPIGVGKGSAKSIAAGTSLAQHALERL